MDRQELIDDIKYIKDVISSSTSYTNISGIAAIVSGIIAIAGCVVSARIMEQWTITENVLNAHIYPLTAIWLSVFFLSIVANLYFIFRKAKKTGEPVWSRLARLILYALSPPLLLGGFLTIFLVDHQQSLWIPASWMLMYGMGIWSAGLFSIPESRCLGALFMITGLLTLFFFSAHSLIAMGIAFGVYHIVYGIRIYYVYGG